MATRKLMHFFVKQVHPDVSRTLPDQARKTNQRSLAVLNGYIDRLDGVGRAGKPKCGPAAGTGSSLAAPVTGQTLPFFRPVLRRSTGEPLPERAAPFSLELKTIPPQRLSAGAAPEEEDFFLRDQLSADLIAQARAAVEQMARPRFESSASPRAVWGEGFAGVVNGKNEINADSYNFSEDYEEVHEGRGCKAESPASPTSVMDRFARLWQAQTHEEMFKDALYDHDGAALQRRRQAMQVFRHKYKQQLLRTAWKTKNKPGRRRRFEGLDRMVEQKMVAKFGGAAATLKNPAGGDDFDPHSHSHSDRPNGNGDEVETRWGDRTEVENMIEEGYHPDLVFLDPSLTEPQKREGIRRCRGRSSGSGGSPSEAEFWLLKNLLHAMREDITARIPLVLVAEEDNYVAEDGCVFVPWNFEVAGLSALLEEEIDQLRSDARKNIRKQTPVS